MLNGDLDSDQKKILYVYSKYSSEKKTIYLQYTAALVIFYFLMKKGIFPSYKEQLLVYDYKDSRRYLWEDKKFMTDINIIRDFNFLNRARLKTAGYRDLNAHYCSEEGHKYISRLNTGSIGANSIDDHLKCKCGTYRQVVLEDECPVLQCNKCKKAGIRVEGFLYNLSESIDYKHAASFL